jgi:hypothetical protein
MALGAFPGLLLLLIFVLGSKTGAADQSFFLLAFSVFAALGVFVHGLPLFAGFMLVRGRGQVRAENLMRTFGPLAERVAGKIDLQRVPLLGYSRPRGVLFEQGTTPCVLDIEAAKSGKRRIYFTRLTFDLGRAPQFQCTVSPANAFAAVGKFLGGQDVTLGWDEFDAQFVVTANDMLQAHEVLNRAIQEQLLTLLEQSRRAQWLGIGSVTLSVRENRVRIRMLGYPQSSEQLLEFYEHGKKLFDQLTPRLRY